MTNHWIFVNFPKRNIGIATINKLFSLAKSNGITCWDIINNCDDEIKIKKFKITKDLQKKLPPFKSLITSLISFSKTKSVYDTVLELFKYIKFFIVYKRRINKRANQYAIR